MRCAVGINAIYNRFNRGKYPDLKLRRVNPRVVFVQVQNGSATHPMPTTDEWREIQQAAGPGGVHARAVPNLISRDRSTYARLYECVKRHRLEWVGGEKVDELVVVELDRLKAEESESESHGDLAT